MKFLTSIKEFIDQNYQTPKGLIGTYIVEKMVRQHKPETDWTIDLLELQDQDHVLELGCGAGYAIQIISERYLVQEIVGIDLSATAIRSATTRNKKTVNKERTKLIQANFNALPFPDKMFNKVFSIQTIYFWDKIDIIVSEIYRVLKPGGMVVITFSNGKDDKTWKSVQEVSENQVMPFMMETGFNDVSLVRGPDSRGFHTVSIKGTKV
ncbi:class I SAM-dependent methyltransferase [Fictibacillus phosphorivorans]|uniref:class I SAM-dependent methyltransferase n=1 Tax=Fictibacillus phosphorivorans TaxID=1221500 RepID=UPI001293059A|nr:class I SAM-dependent methyltransferase [Fictibacillus phosphorivorans]MQR94318.1 class I SAM-dependent methyltransferase [Fictibacillus phosphorivorans]